MPSKNLKNTIGFLEIFNDSPPGHRVFKKMIMLLITWIKQKLQFKLCLSMSTNGIDYISVDCVGIEVWRSMLTLYVQC